MDGVGRPHFCNGDFGCDCGPYIARLEAAVDALLDERGHSLAPVPEAVRVLGFPFGGRIRHTLTVGELPQHSMGNVPPAL